MLFSQYDLTNADERIVEVARLIAGQRTLVRKLQVGLADTRRAEQVLTSLERTLQTFRDHRGQIEKSVERSKI